jgi:hypothetical protein
VIAASSNPDYSDKREQGGKNERMSVLLFPLSVPLYTPPALGLQKPAMVQQEATSGTRKHCTCLYVSHMVESCFARSGHAAAVQRLPNPGRPQPALLWVGGEGGTTPPLSPPVMYLCTISL